MIEQIVQYLASLDSNNFPNKCGVGEREARIACSKCSHTGTVKQKALNFIRK